MLANRAVTRVDHEGLVTITTPPTLKVIQNILVTTDSIIRE